MNQRLLHLYHRLPSWAQSLAASARGYRLRWWRYGPGSERLVEEAVERESWSPERWERWRNERLPRVLERAATRVPYYREMWERRRLSGDRASWEHLENWPILEKETVRRNPRRLLADDCDPRRMFHEHTSGTSGKSLQLWWSRETVARWYALFEARCRQPYGISRADRWAILGGQIVAPSARRKPPFWVWNAALNQLYMSSYHLAPDLIHHYLEAIRRHRVTYLMGYSSSLYTLARGALVSGWRGTPMRVAITNAEPLFDYQKRAIAEAFQCPVEETYGMAEIVTAASECPKGKLHLWPEAGYLEVLEGDHAVPRGTAGELVATGLLNADMPLIRYRLGDRGALAMEDNCGCGRSLPVLAGVEGRLDDVLYTPDGRQIGRLDPIFKAELPIVEAQIIQEAIDRVRLLYVPAPGFTRETAADVVSRMTDRLGAVTIVLESTDAIPREANGKFRAVVSKLNGSNGRREK